MTQEVETAKRVKELVLDGFCVEYKAISICLITEYYKHKGMLQDYAFQIHVDHHKLGGTVSEINESINESVARFFELRGKCYG
jgi:hypothetical protein